MAAHIYIYHVCMYVRVGTSQYARRAGIMGAKATSQLIPLCHNIPLSKVDVKLELQPRHHSVHITAEARTQAQTGD